MVRGMRALSLVAALTSVCVALVAATSTLSGSSSGSSSELSSLDSTCSLATSTVGVCDVRSACSRCWRTDGCEYDLTTRQCGVASNASDALTVISLLPLSATTVSFCADNDRYCQSCTISSYQLTCRGASGCTCRPRCSALRDYEATCYLQSQSTVVYTSIMVVGVVLPSLVMLNKWWARRRGYVIDDIHAEVRRQILQQEQLRWRQRRARPRQPSALALQLDAWRTHREQTKNDMDKVELTNCYALMEGGQSSPSVHQQRPPPSPSPFAHSESKDEDDNVEGDALPRREVAVVVDGAGASSSHV